jgi:ribosome-associated protein
MINHEEITEQIAQKGNFHFSRSSGPGGQNVNKVNTRVSLSLIPEELEGLSPEELLQIKQKLHNRINLAGELRIDVSDTRNQLMNREISIERMAELIVEALKKPKKRRKTKPSRASRERAKVEKQKRKRVKNLRKKPVED